MSSFLKIQGFCSVGTRRPKGLNILLWLVGSESNENKVMKVTENKSIESGNKVKKITEIRKIK